jgi:hypothetical protein
MFVASLCEPSTTCSKSIAIKIDVDGLLAYVYISAMNAFTFGCGIGAGLAVGRLTGEMIGSLLTAKPGIGEMKSDSTAYAPRCAPPLPVEGSPEERAMLAQHELIRRKVERWNRMTPAEREAHMRSY